MSEPVSDSVSDTYAVTVNGHEHTVEGGWPGESLLYALRERIGLYGTKGACEEGECGSCSVVVDGVLRCACLVLASDCAGSTVTTVEALGTPEAPSDVQSAFVRHGGVQCGFCIPGLIVATHDLLDHNPAPTELEVREALSGNICRCTGYGRIIEAVLAVADARQGGPDAAVAP